MRKFELIAPCHFGLEAVLKKEIIELGYDVLQVEDGRVTFYGDEEAVCRANVFLRTAERVLIKVGAFHAETFEELFEGTKNLAWEEYIPENGKFWVAKAASVKSKLFSPSDIQSIMKKAMVERLKKIYHVNWFSEDGESFPVRVFLMKDEVTIGLDTTGESLHKRGYRKLTAKAPIAENLAAALIQLTPWRKDRILVDPFCGSGTFPIEAAMMAAGMAPGMNRNFTAENWGHIIGRQNWYDTVDEARELVDLSVATDIQGYDIDPKMVEIARANAKLAGVESLIHFQRRPVEQLSHPKKYGFILTNPPYGERLEEKENLPAIYKVLGERFRALDDWSMYLITAYEQAERDLGRKADKNRKIYNGMMKTYFYQYMGPEAAAERDMQEKLMRSTAFITSMLAFVAMSVMLNFASSKTIVIAEEVTAGSGAEQEYVERKQESAPLLLKENAAISPSIRIPLPEEVRPDDIVIENYYMEHRIHVIIKGAEKDYYNKKELVGEISRIQAAACYEEAGAVVLAFRMDGLYEHKYLLEENALYLDFVNPHEMYEKIVVLDAGHGGEDSGREEQGLKEKEFALAVVERVQVGLSDTDIRVYCTRQADENAGVAQKIAFINELRPDFVISVHLNSAEEKKTYGTEVWYSADYVIPTFGNPELADILERSVVTAIDGRANGVMACSASAEPTEELGNEKEKEAFADAEIEQLLAGVRVPTAVLRAGYLSNERERELLKQEAYLERIAEGICNAIEEVCQ